jgi:hypothetical protein
MSDDRRRFALRENGEETSLFKGNAPRQAALKVARRIDSRDSEREAIENPERVRLREHGTETVHIYDAWAWESNAPDDGPEWLKDTITRGNVRKVGVREVSVPKQRLGRSGPAKLTIDEKIDFDDEIDVTKEICDRCGHSLKYNTKIRVREILKPSAIRYNRYHYRCENCEDNVIADRVVRNLLPIDEEE